MLVDDQHVAPGDQFVREVRCGCGVEDEDPVTGRGGTGNDVLRDLQLRQYDRCRMTGAAQRVAVLRPPAVRAGDDDDGVVLPGDGDPRCPGRCSVDDGHRPDVHTTRGEHAARVRALGVGPDLGDHRHVDPGQGCGDGLVRALAADGGPDGGAVHGLTRGGERVGDHHVIGVHRPDHDDGRIAVRHRRHRRRLR